jgi:tetratricopeptide (TPR) repeat protein
MRLRSTLAFFALLALTCGAPSSAFADEPGAKEKDPVHAYMAKVQQGQEKIQAGALDEALTLLREAKADQPSKPHAVYFEAVALKLKGDVEEAIQTFRSARVIASHSGDVRVEASALQGAAMALELVPEKRSEARAAWDELRAFLEQNPDAGVAAVPTSRMEKMDQASETEARAEVTRRKIADREEELRQMEAEKAKKKKKKSRR